MLFRQIKTDILVIGGGVSGLMAAYQAPPDRSVMLICSGNGASPFITGFNYVFAEGDSTESFIEDSFSSGAGQNDSALVETMCKHSPETVPFLTGELGMKFDMEDGAFLAKRPVGSSFPRVIGTKNITGAIIGDRLRKKLAEREGFSINDHLRALKLLVKDGKVRGALCMDVRSYETVCVDAKAIVLCTGGFCRLFSFTSNTADIGGDGIAMAYEAGLPLIDLEFIQFEPSGTVVPEKLRGHGMVTTTFYEGAVLYNKDHDRFMLKYSEKGERVNKDVLARGIYCEIAEGRGTENGGVYFDCTAIPQERIHSSYQSYYNKYLAAGYDITKVPIEVAPTAHTSLGGVRINADCTTEIKGLFACGEVAGGLHGANRLGGSAGTETLVFGRLAGCGAAKYISDNDIEPAKESDWLELVSMIESEACNDPVDKAEMETIRERMAEILNRDFNVIRNGIDMEHGLKELEALYKKVRTSGRQPDAEGFYRRTRLQNDLETACLFAVAAKTRPESVGAHWRTDAVPNNGTLYRLQLTRGQNGLEVKRIPVK